MMSKYSYFVERNADQSGLISHFSIAILACTLLGMGLGRFVPPQLSQCAILAGALGVFYYLTCLWRDYRQQAEHIAAVRQVVEQRLATQLHNSGLVETDRSSRPSPPRSPSAALNQYNQLF
jgi:hypothetical protein